MSLRRTPRVVAAFAAVLMLAAALPCAADTLIVDGTADDANPGTLRYELDHAADGDTIDITATGVITLTSGHLVVDKSVTISGPGQDLLTVSGGGAYRVFYIETGKEVTISGLTIANGNTGHTGGGVHNAGTLALEDCTLRDNSATQGGGGVYTEGSLTITRCALSGNWTGVTEEYYGGGAVAAVVRTVWPDYASRYLTIKNSLLTGNTAPYGGGIVIDVEGGDYSGGDAHAWVTVIDSTLSDNLATGADYDSYGGAMAIRTSGDFIASAEVTVENCTLSGNSATGAMYNMGGAIAILTDSVNHFGELILKNSTISGNSALANDENYIGIGGAIWLAGDWEVDDSVTSYFSQVTLDNCTLTGNRDSSGIVSGILNDDGKVEIKNTILGNDPLEGANLYNGFFLSDGSIISHGYNLSSDGGSGFLTQYGDQIDTDPNLGPLAENGGPTLTHALGAGSPAIDAADDTDSAGELVAFDQRGVARPLGGANDIGAFESECSLPYSWSGVLQPLDANGGSVFKAGSTVPVKFELTGCSAGIVDLQATFSYATIGSNVGGSVNESVSMSSATTGDLFRYDPASGQYLFNWSTKGLSRGTYRLFIDLGDGEEHTVELGLR